MVNTMQKNNLKIISCFLGALVSLTLFALPQPQGAEFDYGAKLTVARYSGSSPLAGFPVLVRIAAGSPSGFSYDDLHSKSDGADIAFIDMEGNGLPFEIDTWDPNGTSLIWVRLPSMTNGTEFVMCWGSDKSGKTICSDSPFADYVGVWHMSEASGTVVDSSGHLLAATPAGAAAATSSIAVQGAVGNGRQCSTSTDASARSYLSIPSYNSRNVGNTFAVSGWFLLSASQTSDARFFSRKEDWQESGGWEVICKYLSESPPKNQISARGASSGNKVEKKLSGLLSASEWQHLFVIYNGTSASVYLNGECIAGPGTVAAATDNGKALSIGAYSNDKGSQLVGSVDECRLLDATPSADWAKAEYDSMTKDAFLAFGEVEIWRDMPEPAVGISIGSVQISNAVVTVTVEKLGVDATSATVTVQVSTDFAFGSFTTLPSYSVDRGA